MRTWTIRSTVSSFFTLRMSRASSAVILCSLVNRSVSDPEVAFPTPATSAPPAPGGRYLASESSHKSVKLLRSAPLRERQRLKRTLYGLSPRRGERPPEDPCASDRNLNDDFWRALWHMSYTRISTLPVKWLNQGNAPYPTTQPETMVTEPENCERRASGTARSREEAPAPSSVLASACETLPKFLPPTPLR